MKLNKSKKLFYFMLFLSFINLGRFSGKIRPNNCVLYSKSYCYDLKNNKGILCTPPDISNAGSNQTICVTSSATMAANTPTSGTASWSLISGSGIITNSLSPTTVISSLGIGNNVFEWAITDGICTSVSNVTITVENLPDISMAGANQTLCAFNPTTTLVANTPTSGTGAWSVVVGLATITNPNSPTTALTAVALGTNVLQWSISNGGGCPPSISNVTVEVDPAPSIALAGANQTLCALNPTTTLAANTPTSGIGTWSVLVGAANIANPNSPTTALTAVAVGTSVLQWSISNGGSCPPSISSATVVVDSAPSVALAGVNQTLCALNPTTTLAANTPTSGFGTWAVLLGVATIANPNSPTTALTAVALGTNVLQWSISSGGGCPPSISSLTVVVDSAPSIALAGANQTLCALNPTTALAANTPTSGVGTWALLAGMSTIANPNSPTTALTAVALGTNVLQWTISNGGSCPPSISNVTVEVDSPPSLAFAGANQTLCAINPTTTLAANTPTSGVGTWAVIVGMSTIANPNSPTTALSAVALGTNVLQWTISNGGSCPPSISSVTVEADSPPSLAFAGANQTLCAINPTTTLAANTPTSGVGTWSVVVGAATIANPNSPTTALTAAALGTNVLQWSISNGGSCPPSISTVTVVVDSPPSLALAGVNQTLCAINPTTTLAANTPTSGVGTWAVLVGAATITNPNSPTTALTAVALGTNVLQWSISNGGGCPPSISSVTVEVDSGPSIASAGANQMLCVLNPATTLTGNTPAIGVGTWSLIIGSGIITSPTNPNSTITGLGLGINVLEWSILNGACPISTSTISIDVDNLPTTSNAGSNTSICISNPSITMSGNVPTIGNGVWSQPLGTGTITSANLPNTTITNLGLGFNVFLWTITNGVCPPSLTSVVITVNSLPSIAVAGANQTVCASSPTVALTGNTPAVGNGTWSVIFGGGTVTAPTNPTTSATSLGLGTNILEWSIGTAGCPPNVSSMIIQVDQVPTIANAGPNQTLCITTPTTVLSGNSPAIGNGLWTVISGGGTVVSPTLPTSSVIGLPAGTNILQWTITNGVCTPSISTVTVQVDSAPSLASAGANQTLCISTNSTTLVGNTPTSGIGTWSVIVGAATIANPNSPTTALTAVAVGTNVLEWSISNGGACPPSISNVTVEVDSGPSVASAGPNQTLCSINPTTTLTANTPTSGVGTWSVVLGAATIANPNSPTTALTAVALGTNVLQWSISNGGICPPSISNVTVVVDSGPSVALAGANQTICISTNSATLAGNTPAIGIGTWSLISGSGIITSPTNPNTTITGLGLGINVLEWSISNGVCPPNTSTMSINVDDLPTASNAGLNTSICITTPSITMNGNVPTIGNGVWSQPLGTGTITSANLPTTTITNLGLGFNVFLWTITNGVCPPSLTSVVITVNSLPSIAVAGANQTVCASSPTVALTGNTPAVGNGTWSVIFGSGTVTAPNNPTTNATSLGLGTNILQWSIGTAGCPPNVSSMIIQVDQVPTIANAGPNQTLCITTPTTVLSGNSPAIGNGLWTVISGGGTVVSPTLPTSSVIGLPTGTNILQWAITNGVCAPSISTLSIRVDNSTVFTFAGPNQTLCAASPSTTLAGNTPTAGNGTWSILAGSGSITTPTLSNSTITGLGTGTTILQWNIVNGICSNNNSLVYIYVVPSPGVPNAGPNQTLCITSPTTTISANSPSLGVASWSVVSGTASVLSPTNPNSSVIGLAPGNTILAWTMTYSVCSLTSTLNIHVDTPPSLSNAGANQTICISSASTILAGNIPTSGVGTWSIISGGGVVTTPTLATSSVVGLPIGINILQWTINGGACGISTSTISIKIVNPVTVANAGSNQTLCINNPTAAIAGNVPTVGNGLWSVISGSATITTPLLANSTVSGLGVGLNVLDWTISNGGCTSTSTISIQVDNMPTISNAAPNLSLCISSPTAILTGNIPIVGVGNWSVISGPGVISTPTLGTSLITGLAVGITQLQWTISNGICPSNSSTLNIQVDNIPTTAFAGSNQTLCISSSSTTLAGNTATVGLGTWSIIGGSGTITTPTLETSSVTGLGVGLNVLEWSISTGGCTSTSTLSIQVDNIPTLSNAGTNQTICASSPNIILSGNTALVGTGTWSLIAGSGTIVTPTLATSTLNGLGLGLNILEWTISNGICLPTTSTVSIQVDLLGTPATASPNQTICITSPTATIFGNTPTTGIGSWSLVSGTGTLVSALTETTNLTNLGPGINVFAWTINNGGCSSTSTVSITVDTAPTIANAGPNQSACINSLVATMNANTALSGIGTWSLVSGSGTITNINFENTTITNLGFGVDVFVWTIANSCSSSSSTVSISIDQAPTTAIASPNQSICITSPTTSISGNIPTIGVGTWSLVLGSGTITSASSPTTTLTNIGVGNNVFAWEISNGVCAPSVSEVTITVEPLPTLANAGVNQTVCVTSPALMSANYAAVGTGSWSVISGIGTITSINSETTSITNLGLGNNVFAWTISSNCGSSVSNVTITVDQVPTTAIASPNQSICVTSPTASISGNLPVVGVGTWSLISGSGTLTSITSPTTTITNIGIGTNIFAWMISNGVCAASTSTTQVTVNSFPTVPNAGSNQTICVSNMAIMNANSAVIGSGLWSVIAGGGIITTPTLGTTSISGLNIGNNIFGWTIGNSCSSLTSTVSVFVDQLPSASFAGIDQNYCLATSATLNATNPLVGVGSWSVIAGGGSVSFLNLSNSLVTGLTTGTNALIWAVSNGVCNVAKDTVNIVIDALPTKADAGLDLTTCSTTTLLNGNAPVVGNGVWYVIGGGGSVATATLPNTSVSGLTTPTNILVWSITNGACPFSEDTVLINILPPTVPAFAGNDTIISVGELTLYAINPTSGSGSWSIISGGGSIANTNLNNTSVTGLNFGLTTLEWSITDVCGVTKDEVNITYVEEILPNSFSPNGDGTNDSFDIPYIGSYKTVEIKILNRWGNIVYEDVIYKNNWFGTNKNGEPLSEDTYFYLIKLNEKIKNGYITIKR